MTVKTGQGSGTEGAIRRLPIGAEANGTGVHFRVWAPKRKRVEVVLEKTARAIALKPERNGYFSTFASEADNNTLYRYRLDGEATLYPDPVSRFQPQGPHGPSQVVDPRAFTWTDLSWKGVRPEEAVFYEMHIGTFTPEGTYRAAIEQLPFLRDLGVNCLEIMPLAEFPGRFGWGYDGVDLYAPSHLYGYPNDLRSLIDSAHQLGIAAILDVVYNHLGPDGNYLKAYADRYFSTRHKTEWGEAINFDDVDCEPVREFFIANARYWIEEFHFDGFRFDATQAIFDDSPRHILADIVKVSRDAARGRQLHFVAECEPQLTKLVRAEEKGGYGLTALWNDDFHHSATVALTGRSEAYYTDYQATPQEFISSAKWGYLYQGQRYKWQEKRRGTPALDLPPAAFVNYIQNHDQVANSARGQRCHELSGPALYRAITALFLLMPQTPMLFQGQEFASTAPFFYFADQNRELAPLIRKGRARFLSQFPTIATAEIQAQLADPGSETTFTRCKLDFREREKNPGIVELHRDLLKLRREDPTIAARRRGSIDGAVLGTNAFLLRYFSMDAQDRLILVNFGNDLCLNPAPEPLLAPPLERRWKIEISTEDQRYGGNGQGPLEGEESWMIPGRATAMLRPVTLSEAPPELPRQRGALYA